MLYRILGLYGLAIASIALAEEPQVDPTPNPDPAPTSETAKPTPGFPIPLPPESTGQPWLGVNLGKPDPTVTAHIPTLPPGIGMIVESVVPGSPAEAAGLASPDLLWKLGDQMLVNYGQLVTLLRLSKPGDEVTLSIFRAGIPMEIKLVLGEAPPPRKGFNAELAERILMPDEKSPVRMVKFDSQSAIFSDEDSGKAVVSREGEAYKVVITDPEGKVIYDGAFPEDREAAGIPKMWLHRIYVLRRGLERALENEMVPVRPPRPRVIPPDSTTK
ncbi:PDZ domain-containing protein [Luteolibacter pohnpeiensis]|uniref:PDZ domain-containing protein n=1 Tax=Luteolibacter pohnpeiensis TaxID=454153 RepID=A0A934SFJ1_9BACT|nr:PDZ domain-containing protein [Luteolibacter pohnpeiensis]MBK1884253.1 PDZ domain-containing protein [Luteolibacter pohnpeiensis]